MPPPDCAELPKIVLDVIVARGLEATLPKATPTAASGVSADRTCGHDDFCVVVKLSTSTSCTGRCVVRDNAVGDRKEASATAVTVVDNSTSTTRHGVR